MKKADSVSGRIKKERRNSQCVCIKVDNYYAYCYSDSRERWYPNLFANGRNLNKLVGVSFYWDLGILMPGLKFAQMCCILG